MRAGPQTRGPTLVQGGLEKSAYKFYAGQTNPTCFLRVKCGTSLCGAGQPATPNNHLFINAKRMCRGHKMRRIPITLNID